VMLVTVAVVADVRVTVTAVHTTPPPHHTTTTTHHLGDLRENREIKLIFTNRSVGKAIIIAIMPMAINGQCEYAKSNK